VISIKAWIEGKYISCEYKQYNFAAVPATAGQRAQPARDVEVYRLTLLDPSAEREEDQTMVVSIPLDKALEMGMDKPEYDAKNQGKTLKIEGYLAKSPKSATYVGQIVKTLAFRVAR